MGGSSSSSSNKTTTYQTSSSAQTTTTTQGGSGSESPTVNAAGAVTIQNAGGEVSLEALRGMSDVVQSALSQQNELNQAALAELSDFNARQQEGITNQTSASNDLLSKILGNNQTLAENVQSGGATVGMSLTTKIVWGVLALAAGIVALVIFRSK
jgi:hypothetical protein